MQYFPDLIAGLSQRMQQPLPGLDIQMEMSPPHRGRPTAKEIAAKNPRMAAVLLLLYPHEENTKLVMIQRPVYAGVHSGQISLPGGAYENHDSDLAATALRESREELGIVSESLKLLGPLSALYIPPSNFMVHPYVAITHERPHFVPQPEEVAEVLEFKLVDFLERNNQITKKIQLPQLHFDTPAYRIGQHEIWGATAMIMREFAELTAAIQRIQ